MEKDVKKEISLAEPPEAISDEMLLDISGGKQHRDENGNWDTNMYRYENWVSDTRDHFYYKLCPNCKHLWAESFNERYNSNVWWYCYWYNRLYCYKCNTWTDEID